jgi:hypothetical protein
VLDSTAWLPAPCQCCCCIGGRCGNAVAKGCWWRLCPGVTSLHVWGAMEANPCSCLDTFCPLPSAAVAAPAAAATGGGGRGAPQASAALTQPYAGLVACRFPDGHGSCWSCHVVVLPCCCSPPPSGCMLLQPLGCVTPGVVADSSSAWGTRLAGQGIWLAKTPLSQQTAFSIRHSMGGLAAVVIALSRFLDNLLPFLGIEVWCCLASSE